jgi:hypothetical protein
MNEIDKLQRIIAQQRTEIERLRIKLVQCHCALELFCQRRDRGEIQSSTTYRQFKELLAKHREQELEGKDK